MVIGAIVLLSLVTLSFIQIRGQSNQDAVRGEIHRMSDSKFGQIGWGANEKIDQSVNSAIRLNCLSAEKNSEEGVSIFNAQLQNGELSEEETKSKVTIFLLFEKK
jgi:hypothetical protein